MPIYVVIPNAADEAAIYDNFHAVQLEDLDLGPTTRNYHQDAFPIPSEKTTLEASGQRRRAARLRRSGFLVLNYLGSLASLMEDKLRDLIAEGSEPNFA